MSNPESSDPILELAIKAARAAGAHIQASVAQLSELKIEQKSLFDYVSRVDRESETLIRDEVNEAFPEHGFIGEEYGSSDSGAVIQWVVDPLDGTTNFLRGIAHYAVSIAVMQDQQLTHAVVFDPAKDELFSASAGKGAWLNEKQIHCAKLDAFAGVLLATGVPYSGENLAEVESFTNTMNGLLKKQTSGIRRLGAAALDLAYVAAGRYDGFWEANLKPWDIAAGVLLVQEAGGQVMDFTGGQDYLDNGDIIAAPGLICEEMLSVVGKCYRR